MLGLPTGVNLGLGPLLCEEIEFEMCAKSSLPKLTVCTGRGFWGFRLRVSFMRLDPRNISGNFRQFFVTAVGWARFLSRACGFYTARLQATCSNFCPAARLS